MWFCVFKSEAVGRRSSIGPGCISIFLILSMMCATIQISTIAMSMSTAQEMEHCVCIAVPALRHAGVQRTSRDWECRPGRLTQTSDCTRTKRASAR